MTDIKNRAHMSQIKDFSGLRFGKITPTDIDGFIDFGGKLFVFIEAKYGEAQLSFGQRLALERLVDACHRPPDRHSILFLVRHDSEKDIDLAEARVTNVRIDGVWTEPKLPELTLFNAIEYVRGKYGT
jgi:hypothetical protein